MDSIQKPIKLVLVDRDGVINRDLPTGVRNIDEFELIPNAARAIRLLNEAHIPVVVITNQALVGRGEISEADLQVIHQHMIELLAQGNAKLDGIQFCCDVTVEPNQRRKPAPGMLYEAMAQFKGDPESTVMIGDAMRDLQAGFTANCQRILVKTGKGLLTLMDPKLQQFRPVALYDDLYAAVMDILDV
jgi:D-glycero-D-manno-heptose 1,7-bisphosphate phosphatase